MYKIRGVSLDFLTVLFLALSGFVAAFFDSVVGGGGLIATPALMMVGLPVHMVLGSNKLAAVMSDIVGCTNFIRAKKVNFELIWQPMLLAALFSSLGSYIATLVSVAFMSNLVVIMLIIVAVYTMITKNFGEIKAANINTKFINLATLVIGFYTGFFGPGAGSFWVFALVMAGFNFIGAAANTRLINFSANIAGLAVFMYTGNINYLYGLVMGGFMLIGAYIGTKFALSHGNKGIKPMYLCVTLALIVKQIFDILK